MNDYFNNAQNMSKFYPNCLQPSNLKRPTLVIHRHVDLMQIVMMEFVPAYQNIMEILMKDVDQSVSLVMTAPETKHACETNVWIHALVHALKMLDAM
jgi:hypothetical protein